MTNDGREGDLLSLPVQEDKMRRYRPITAIMLILLFGLTVVAIATKVSSLTVMPGNIEAKTAAGASKFKVTGTTGDMAGARDFALTRNCTIGGTLTVTGVTTLASAIDLDAGITVDTNHFVVHGTTGISSVKSTATDTYNFLSNGDSITTGDCFRICGTSAMGTDGYWIRVLDDDTEVFSLKRTAQNTSLAAITGALTVSTTLAVTGTSTLTGNTAVTGTLTTTGATVLNGGLTMDTNKFTVANTSGDTLIAGSLAANGGIACDTNAFTVADITGDTLIAGTLTLTGAQTSTGLANLNGGIAVDTDGFTVNGTNWATAIKSVQATALCVGAGGSTDPVLTVDASTGSQKSGMKITGGTTTGTTALQAISNGATVGVTIDGKAAGTVGINTAAATAGQVTIGNTTALLGLRVNGPLFVKGGTSTPIVKMTVSAHDTQTATLLAAELLGGICSQNSKTGASTATLDTGANITTAVTALGVTTATGDSFTCTYANIGNQTVTITAASGATLVPTTATVATLRNAILTFVCTGANTWVCYVTISGANT